MRDLILQSLQKSIKAYPELLDHLKGTASWIGAVYAYKAGEAPDDELRKKDERRLTRKLESFFEGQLARIIASIEEQFKSFQPGFWDDEEQWMWNEMSEDFVGILIHGTNGGINALPENVLPLVDRDIINMAMIDFARKYRNEWLFKITETSRAFVEKSIQEWLVSGKPLNDLVKALANPDVGMFNKLRAERIAVTETTRLFAMGNKMAWEQTGYVEEFRWMTANDERVCEICGPNDNKLFPLSQLADLIPAHVNCRYYSLPVVNVDRVIEQIEW